MKKCYKCSIDKPLTEYLNNSIVCLYCHALYKANLISEAENNLNKNINCVYYIKCLVNDKIYIGSSNYFGKRKISHLNKLIKGKHKCKDLQNDFTFYGSKYFEFGIIEHNLINFRIRELELIREYVKKGNIYNVNITCAKLDIYEY